MVVSKLAKSPYKVTAPFPQLLAGPSPAPTPPVSVRELLAMAEGIKGRCRIIRRKITEFGEAGVDEVAPLLSELDQVMAGPLSKALEEGPGLGAAFGAPGLASEVDLAKSRLATIEAALLAVKARSLVARRKEERHQISAEIGLSTGTNFFTGFTQNISSGGLFIVSDDHLPRGTRVDLSFGLADRKISAIAEVTWVRQREACGPDSEPGMGLRFMELSAGDAAAIDAFMRLREPIFFEV